MHLTLISRQALRGIQTQGMEPSLIATAALSLMSFAFRPEGPRQRVKTTEFLIRNYIADKLSIDSSTIPEDTALLISGRMSGDFISGLLKKPDQLQRNWFQRLRPSILAPYGAIKDCCNC